MLLRLLSFIRSWLAPRRGAVRPSGTMLERLEDRIAPATFVNGHIVTYNDVDGDHVTIHSSRPIFIDTGASPNVDTLLIFNTGTVNGSNTTPQQLQEMDLLSLASTVVAGDNISITVQKVPGGDGLANVGAIESNFALGHVVVQGDLGRIEAGSNSFTSANYAGLASLTVHSLGGQGTATQPAGGNLLSSIIGNVGSLTVQQDMTDAEFSVVSSGAAGNGGIHSVNIGGSLIGGANTTDSFGNTIYAGNITTAGSVGSIVIGLNIAGGSGTNSGSLQIGGKIGSLSVDNIVGYTLAGDTTGMGAGSGSVEVGTSNTFSTTGGVGSINIKGNLQGGDGSGSGEISQANFSGGFFGPVKIGGMIAGGTGTDSGEIDANGFGSISIGHGITGSSGAQSGSIVSNNGITSLVILDGGIAGGTGTGSGSVDAANSPETAANIGSIVIHGDIAGNSGAATTVTGAGQISTASSIGSLTLYGSLVGSVTAESGSILATESIGHVFIHPNGSSTGSILGGSGSNSGEISAYSIGSVSVAGQILGSGSGSGKILSTTSIGNVTVGDGITGGSGTGSGVIITGTPTEYGDNLGSLTVTAGGITGGMGDNSGQVSIGGSIGFVHLDGGAITGMAGASSGAILATNNIGSISLGSLIDGSGAGSGAGQISSGGNVGSLAFTGVTSSATTVSGLVDITGSAGSVSVHGDVAGSGASTGLFLIGGAVNRFSISGALRGGSGSESGSIFAGLDDTSRIGFLTVSGGLVGGSGDGSGEVFGGGGIARAVVGDIIGGGGQLSGSLVSDYALGAVTVTGTGVGLTAGSVTTHGILGGSGSSSGEILSGTTIGSVSLHGLLQGGAGGGSGAIVSNSSFTPSGDVQGNIGSISILGSIIGGAGANSGQISAAGNIATLSITGNVTGAAVSGAGAVLAGTDLTAVTGGNITTLKIAGALQGAVVPAGSATITGSGYIEAGHIGSATIGSIQAGSVGAGNTVTGDGAILAANDIASLTVTGSITGDSTNPVVISAVGQVTPGPHGDLAFGRISVGGSVKYANFLAGYDQDGSPDPNAGAASIGSVFVGGDWSGSNLVAGVVEGFLPGPPAVSAFGASNDTLITSISSVIPTIASIIIKGQVQGVGASPDTYGFVAEKIDAFSLDGVAQSVALGLIDPVGQSTDTVLRDVS